MMRKKRSKNKNNNISNYAKSLREHKKEISEFKKQQRDYFSTISVVNIGDIVSLSYKGSIIKCKVLKINKLTYKIDIGGDDYVLIDKESLIGYSNFLKKSYTGDGRRFIGEEYRLIVIIKE